MNNCQNNTAILFFSNSVEEEVKRKQFSFSKKEIENKQLAHLLIDHNLNICQKTGLPIEIIDSSLQRGEGFGARLKNAFEDVFAKGYSNIIAIGSDCLELQPKDLKLAKETLVAREVPLGPCKDGGIYLLGLSRIQFDNIDFKSVTWGSSAVFLELYKQVNNKWNCKVFDLKTDIDFPLDLREIISHSKKWFRFSIVKKIISIILSYSVVVVKNCIISFNESHKIPSQRGPPVLAV